MADDKREGWLKDLKKGDVVGCDGGGFSRQEVDKLTVKRITPAGKIMCVMEGSESEWEFKPNGRKNGGGSWDFRNLVPWTPEVEAKQKRQRLEHATLRYLDQRVVDREKVKALTDEHLGRLYSFLRSVRVD